MYQLRDDMMGHVDADESSHLEDEFWDCLEGISSYYGFTTPQLVDHINLECGAVGLPSAIRVFVLEYYTGYRSPDLRVALRH
jgi:predicted DNA-binding ribbon-helix-helix protein